MSKRTVVFLVLFVVVLGLKSGLLSVRSTGAPVKTPLLTDDSGILPEPKKGSIERYLDYVRRELQIDYRVAILPELSESDLLKEGVDRFQEMKIGKSTEGKGLLLLVDPEKKRARVEVGYALEPFLTDLHASEMINDFLSPYYRSNRPRAGIEASIEHLINVLKSRMTGGEEALAVTGSGGAGATDQLADIPDSRLTEEVKAKLRKIMVPQPRPEDCLRLELSLMKKGIYYRDVPLYDEDWRKAVRPAFPPSRLKAIAREWDQPFEVLIRGPHAIAYYEDQRRWGPVLFYRAPSGWIMRTSLVAKYIIYDYSNEFWYAVDADYPYLSLIRSVYNMKRVKLNSGRFAWMVVSGKGRLNGSHDTEG